MSTTTNITREVVIVKLMELLTGDPNVQFALVFGSYAQGRQKRGSDLDVAVFFANPPNGLDKLNFINRLSDISRMDVDLVILNTASPLLRHQVMKYGIRLIVKDGDIYRRFREKTISDYDEYKYISGIGMYG